MAIFTFVPRVNAQSDTANSKVFLSFNNSKAISNNSKQIYAGFGVKFDNLLQEKAKGTNFVFNFGAKWGRKNIKIGFEGEISQYSLGTKISLNDGSDIVLCKDLSSLKIGPTISFGFGKKFNATTNLYLGYINGKVKGFEIKKRSVELFCSGISQEISYKFMSCLYNNKFDEQIEFVSFYLFVKGGIEGCSDRLLVEPKGELTYDAVITCGLKIGIFSDNKPNNKLTPPIKCPNLY